jgi:photosystem II stability/assembly factor-like uncharacterized protein
MKHRILIAFIVTFTLTLVEISAATEPHKKTLPPNKVRIVHKKIIKHTLRKNRIHKHRKDTVTENYLKQGRNYPPPGSSGEERNFDWYRKRAFPNDEIDPSAYLNALEQARNMPVYKKPSGKNGIEASMQWQQIGPFTTGGRVTAIATHPTDPNTFYVGAAAGGLWKTSDHGKTWQSLTDNFPMLSIGCITIDPHDANTIYIGMGECNGSADSYPGNGLLRSTNGGLSWTSLGLTATQYISKIIIDPFDKNTIYACVPGPNASADSNRGVWKSNDYGLSWRGMFLLRAGKSRTSTPVPAIDLVMNPSDHLDLIVSTWQHITSLSTGAPNLPYSGLFRTKDSGATWNRIDTISGSGYINGITYKHLSRTSLLWVNNNIGVPTLYSVTSSIDKDPVTGYYLADNFYGLYRTNNPELGWQKILDSSYRLPFLGNNIDSVNLFNRQGGYDNFIVAHPRRPDEIYIGGIDIIRSVDGGSTWKNITNAYPHYFNNDRTQHSDMHALAFTADISGNDILNGQDGGVFNTTDFGNTWSRINGLPITMFYHLEPWVAGMENLPNSFPADSIKMMGGTQDNGTVAHGFSGNPDWDWINRGDGGESQSDPHNKNHLITSIQLGKILFRSSLDSLRPNLFSDAGNLDPNAKRWFDLSVIAKRRGITDSSEACAFIPPVVLDKQNGVDVYTGRTFVYKAKLNFADPDSGTSIVKWSTQLAGNPSNPKAWYYGQIDAIALGVRDSHSRPMIWAAGILNTSRAVWRTTVNESLHADSISKWIRSDATLPTLAPSVIIPDRSDSLTAFIGLSGFISDTIGHIFKTIDGGKTWKKIGVGLPNAPVNAMIIDSLAEGGDPLKKNQFIIAATDVGVFATTNGGAKWYILGENMPHLVVGTIFRYKNWLVAGTHGRSAWALDVTDFASQLHEDVAENKQQKFSVTLFPNPVNLNLSPTLHIRIKDINAQNIPVELFNSSGVSVLKTMLSLNSSEADLHLPESIPSGNYLLRVTLSDGATSAEHIIIAK